MNALLIVLKRTHFKVKLSVFIQPLPFYRIVCWKHINCSHSGVWICWCVLMLDISIFHIHLNHDLGRELLILGQYISLYLLSVCFPVCVLHFCFVVFRHNSYVYTRGFVILEIRKLRTRAYNKHGYVEHSLKTNSLSRALSLEFVHILVCSNEGIIYHVNWLYINRRL